MYLICMTVSCIFSEQNFITIDVCLLSTCLLPKFLLFCYCHDMRFKQKWLYLCTCKHVLNVRMIFVFVFAYVLLPQPSEQSLHVNV